MSQVKDKNRFAKTVNIKNRKASFEFEFIEKVVAGMVLMGTEIKSIREGKATLNDAYCYFNRDELYVKQLHITPYNQAAHFNHVSDRERKLLLSKKEIEKLQSKMDEKGLTIIPIRLFINDRGFAKLEIALARGKKLHDKRQDMKAKDAKREMDRLKF